MNNLIETHLEAFKSIKCETELAYYVIDNILPDECLTLDYIMAPNNENEEIKKSAKIINDLMEVIHFDELPQPYLIQSALLRGAYSFRELIPHYMDFYEDTRWWLFEHKKMRFGIDF